MIDRIEPSSCGTPNARMYQIGEVVAATGLTHRALRHYDSLGLVSPELRSSGNFRFYSGRQVEHLQLLRSLRPMGLPLPFLRSVVAVLDAVDRGTELYRSEAERVVQRLRWCQEDTLRHINDATASLHALAGVLEQTSDAAHARQPHAKG